MGEDVIFPWRHESTPPDRILEEDDLSGMPNNTRARFIRRLVACRTLHLSFIEALPLPFYKFAWEADLAANFATAFGFALSELLKGIFNGKVEVKNEIIGVTVDSSI